MQAHDQLHGIADGNRHAAAIGELLVAHLHADVRRTDASLGGVGDGVRLYSILSHDLRSTARVPPALAGPCAFVASVTFSSLFLAREAV